MSKAEAREAMRLHARTGISLKEAWRRIRGGRGSHGGGRKTKRTGSSRSSKHSGGHSGGRSMGEKAAPKPRLALYAGAAGSALIALGATKSTALPNDVTAAGQRNLRAVGANLTAITTTAPAAIAVATPLAAGGLASIVADKLGVNKRLAKMRAPFRI